MQPDVEDVLQVEDPEGTEATVKVVQQGPVRTQALPSKAGSTRTVLVNPLPSPTLILRANPRRRQALVVAPAAFLVAYGDANAQDVSTMALWPANVPLPVTAVVDVWVAAPTATVSVSIVSEFWATGEGDD
jgi:hypothetical protein